MAKKQSGQVPTAPHQFDPHDRARRRRCRQRMTAAAPAPRDRGGSIAGPLSSRTRSPGQAPGQQKAPHNAAPHPRPAGVASPKETAKSRGTFLERSIPEPPDTLSLQTPNQVALAARKLRKGRGHRRRSERLLRIFGMPGRNPSAVERPGLRCNAPLSPSASSSTSPGDPKLQPSECGKPPAWCLGKHGQLIRWRAHGLVNKRTSLKCSGLVTGVSLHCPGRWFSPAVP